ncbi:MAG: CHASE2 domain-containing protein [Candidatus Kapabacteria bacterium]|nr:CHASE2 domain-containing protein [Candidatus Kapabacteria bacterium]
MFNPIQNTFQSIEITDLVFSQLRDQEKTPLDTNIILVNNGSLQRAQLALVMQILNKHQPKVIGIDAMFRRPKGEINDLPLAQQFSDCRNLVLVSDLVYNGKKDLFDTINKSMPLFMQFAKDGYANMITGNDSTDGDNIDYKTVRSFKPITKVKDTTKYFFPVKIASIFSPEKVKKFLKRDNELEVINYRRNTNKYRTLDYKDVIANEDSLQFIKDKIVLIGFMGPDLKNKVTEDIFFSPLNKQYVGKTTPDMYGVVIHANIISMILNDDCILTLPQWLINVITFVLLYLNMALYAYSRNKFGHWYQTFNLGFTLFELAFLGILVLYCLLFFNLELKLYDAFFAILFSTTAHESYSDSLKPLALEAWVRLKRLIKK